MSLASDIVLRCQRGDPQVAAGMKLPKAEKQDYPTGRPRGTSPESIELSRQVAHLRESKGMSWVAIAFALDLSSAFAAYKRYYRWKKKHAAEVNHE